MVPTQCPTLVTALRHHELVFLKFSQLIRPSQFELEVLFPHGKIFRTNIARASRPAQRFFFVLGANDKLVSGPPSRVLWGNHTFLPGVDEGEIGELQNLSSSKCHLRAIRDLLWLTSARHG